jgi:hypothetical protein
VISGCRQIAQLKNELRIKESMIEQKDEDKAEAVHAVTKEFKMKIAELNNKIRTLTAADAEV